MALLKGKILNFLSKKYIYEYDEMNDEDGYESHECRIKERLYSRGIVAEEFHDFDNDYSDQKEHMIIFLQVKKKLNLLIKY